MSIKGTKTEQNLKTALLGESHAAIKYLLYAHKIEKEGYKQIADVFEEISKNEKAHAEIWLKLLNECRMPGVDASLKDAIAGERYEYGTMYKNFAEDARKEGFESLANLFEGIGSIEVTHEEMYAELLSELEQSHLTSRNTDVVWKCSNCGYRCFGKCAPYPCPICKHSVNYFKVI